MESMEGIQVEVSEIGKGSEAVCILCESGYHDHAWDILHVMKCGCPCHGKQASATATGK